MPMKPYPSPLRATDVDALDRLADKTQEMRATLTDCPVFVSFGGPEPDRPTAWLFLTCDVRSPMISVLFASFCASVIEQLGPVFGARLVPTDRPAPDA